MQSYNSASISSAEKNTSKVNENFLTKINWTNLQITAAAGGMKHAASIEMIIQWHYIQTSD